MDIGSVHVQLLPRPAFDLENLVVYDDPAFGAEPIVRATEVTAAIRLTSLLRGRLEISRLDLTEPSLNIVHGQNGHWNLEALLERSARIPLAPTGKNKSEPKPGFPYIEATSGRINFKNGPEKRPYALTNADFSLWQESQNTWGIRLKAQPFRTDMNLNDTGLLQVDGIWQRSATIQDTPLNLKLEWSHAQLGQMTKLISGNDQGWRGEILLDVALKGTPSRLQIAASSSIDDFRRYDITSGRSLRLRGRCDAEYSSESHAFQRVMCNAPVGDGFFTLAGDAGYPGTHHYSFLITAEAVPAAGLVMLAQQVKKNLPDDLTAEGTLDGKVSLQNNGNAAEWKGRGEIADLQFSSASSKSEIGPETLRFVLATDASARVSHKRLSSVGARDEIGSGTRLEIGPFHLGSARPGMATIRGSLNRVGYNFSISGETEIPKALRLAKATGLPAISSSADGSAQLDLQLSGNWIISGDGSAVSQMTGSAKLRNVRTTGPAAAEIISAEMQLLPEAVHVSKMNARAAGSLWTGSVDLPRGCGTPDACLAHFSLSTKSVDLGKINNWLNPNVTKRPWYQVLTSNSESHPAWWTSVRAVGRISADEFHVHNIDATLVSANLMMERGKLQFSAVRADLLGGSSTGEWKVEFANKPAICSGTGTLAGVSLSTIADAMNDGWVEGLADGSYEVKGPCLADFWEKADGNVHVEVRDGIFPHILFADSTEPLRASEIKGKARLHAGDIEISETQLVSSDGIYRVAGTVSLDREMNLKLTRISNNPDNAGYSISGPLETPRITALIRTEQARLKAPSSQ